jgi:pilus assembly protein CpaB
MTREPQHRFALMISIGVAMVGFALLVLQLKRLEHDVGGGAPVTLLALREHVDAGSSLRDEHLVAYDVPERYVETRQVLARDLRRVIGVRTAVDLEANQSLRWTDLETTMRAQDSLSERIPRGMRGVTVEQSERRPFGGLLRPGDRVDVLLTTGPIGAGAGGITLPLLQNALVLAVGDGMQRETPASTLRASKEVTLLVSNDAASLLAHAKGHGSLSLTLRNHDDLEVMEGARPIRDEDVLAHERAARPKVHGSLERVD